MSAAPYAEQAAVLAHFRSEWIETDDPDRLTTFLWDECERVRADGRPYWRLRDAARAQILHTVPRRRLRATLEAVAPPDDLGPVQDLLTQFLHDEPIVAADLDRPSLAALAQLEQWTGPRPDLPEAGSVERQLQWRALTDPLHRLLSGAFVGRADVLAELRDHIDATDEPTLFVLHGVGGSGKSTVLARMLLDTPTTDLISYVNYDRSWLIETGTVGLFDELVRQVSLQLPDGPARDELDELRATAARLLATRFSSADAASSVVQQFVDVPDELVARLGAVIGLHRDKWIVAVDTYEEIQRRDLSDASVHVSLLSRLRGVLPGVRAVVAGRAPVPRIEANSRALGALRDHEAGELLTRLTDRSLAPDTVDELISFVGGNPLAVRLAAVALNQRPSADPVELLAIVEDGIEGQLYGRILDHIDDDDVRALAHPGLVLRRIAPDVIRHVLAGPCGLGPVDDTRAWDLYYRLRAEATLMEDSSEEVALVERSDVRALMLPALERSDGDRVEEIHRAAIAWYSGQTGTIARREELYHRLMLGEDDPAVLDGRWDPVAGGQVLSALHELPAAGQAYLAGKLTSVRLDPAVRRAADDEQWRPAVAAQATRKIANNELDDALALLRERRGPDGEALLPELEIDALERLGFLDDAGDLAHQARVDAARHRQPAEVERYTRHECRLRERQRRFTESFALIDGLITATGARRRRRTSVDDLVDLTVWLRLARRTDQPTGVREPHLAAAVTLAGALPLTELRLRPGLLRELAAEIGALSAFILQEARKLVPLDPVPDLPLDVITAIDESRFDDPATRVSVAAVYQRLTDWALGLGD